MKKLIVTLLFVLTVSLNAQIVIKLDSFYFFKYKSEYNVYDALNNNLHEKRGSGVAGVTLKFDTISMVGTQENLYDNSVDTFPIIRTIHTSNDVVTYVVRNEVGDFFSYTYFQNTPSQKQVICLWKKSEHEMYGWQSVAK